MWNENEVFSLGLSVQRLAWGQSILSEQLEDEAWAQSPLGAGGPSCLQGWCSRRALSLVTEGCAAFGKTLGFSVFSLTWSWQYPWQGVLEPSEGSRCSAGAPRMGGGHRWPFLLPTSALEGPPA